MDAEPPRQPLVPNYETLSAEKMGAMGACISTRCRRIANNGSYGNQKTEVGKQKFSPHTCGGGQKISDFNKKKMIPAIIPYYKNKNQLEKCIAHLKDQTVEVETFIRDNSDDNIYFTAASRQRQ